MFCVRAAQRLAYLCGTICTISAMWSIHVSGFGECPAIWCLRLAVLLPILRQQARHKLRCMVQRSWASLRRSWLEHFSDVSFARLIFRHAHALTMSLDECSFLVLVMAHGMDLLASSGFWQNITPTTWRNSGSLPKQPSQVHSADTCL